MAISHHIPNQYGIEIPNGYWRVEAVELSSKETIRFCARAYVDRNKHPIHYQWYTCAYAIDGDNPIRQAYLHLKTLPEFANAVDC